MHWPVLLHPKCRRGQQVVMAASRLLWRLVVVREKGAEASQDACIDMYGMLVCKHVETDQRL